MTFSDAVQVIFDIEGGYHIDPDDPGGETNFGISKRSYPEEDIKGMTPERARLIYHRDFWTYCQCDNLPKGVDLIVFDGAVNQGPITAVKLLQQTLGAKSDGIVGSDTIRRANQIPNAIEELCAQRALHYVANPRFDRNGEGWMRRLMKILVLASRDH